YGAGNVAKQGLDNVGPDGGRRFQVFARDTAQRPGLHVRYTIPSPTHQLCEVCHHRACHQALHVVQRAVDAVLVFPFQFEHAMVTGIPTLDRHIHSAGEGDLVIDHDHLLVLAAAHGATAIQPDMHVV